MIVLRVPGVTKSAFISHRVQKKVTPCFFSHALLLNLSLCQKKSINAFLCLQDVRVIMAFDLSH